MSDSLSVSSSKSDDEGFEITGDIRIIKPKRGCEDEVRTTLVGSGKAVAGPNFADTNAYLGFYEGEVVEAYFKKVGRGGGRVHCSAANWAAIARRLDLNDDLKSLSRTKLMDVIRERTREDAPLSAGSGVTKPCPVSFESLESSLGAGTRAEALGVEAGDKAEDLRPQGGDLEVEARRREGGARVAHRQGTAAIPRIFYMRLIDVAALHPLVLVGLGMVLAYISTFFAFILLLFVR
jgi:hypothetical protein